MLPKKAASYVSRNQHGSALGLGSELQSHISMHSLWLNQEMICYSFSGSMKYSMQKGFLVKHFMTRSL